MWLAVQMTWALSEQFVSETGLWFFGPSGLWFFWPLGVWFSGSLGLSGSLSYQRWHRIFFIFYWSQNIKTWLWNVHLWPQNITWCPVLYIVIQGQGILIWGRRHTDFVAITIQGLKMRIDSPKGRPWHHHTQPSRVIYNNYTLLAAKNWFQYNGTSIMRPQKNLLRP